MTSLCWSRLREHQYRRLRRGAAHGVVLEGGQAVGVAGAVDGVAADADTGGEPDAAQLVHGATVSWLRVLSGPVPFLVGASRVLRVSVCELR